MASCRCAQYLVLISLAICAVLGCNKHAGVHADQSGGHQDGQKPSSAGESRSSELTGSLLAADSQDTSTDDGLTDLEELPASANASTPSADASASTSAAVAAGESAQTSASVVPPTGPSAGRPILLGSPELTAGIPGSGPLTLAELEIWLANPVNHEPLSPLLPAGLSLGAANIKIPADNPLTLAKIELGRQLYFDPRLSSDRSVSCASCHHPDEGYARHSQFGVGIGGQQGGRNAPAGYNRILSDKQFWDGRAESLEAQAIGPIANPLEMGNTHAACLECLLAIEGYKLQFDKIFGGGTIENVGKALASFERALVTAPAPYDVFAVLEGFKDQDEEDLRADPELWARFQQAQQDTAAHPMSAAAIRGRDVFFSQKANCTTCHVGANFSDEKYHNLGVGMSGNAPDIGREAVTQDERDRGAFKTPTIRNVALSAPYMHDGSQPTLEEVVDWYAKGGHPNPYLSDKIKKLDLSDQDKADLVEFMKALTGEFPNVARDRLPE